MDNYFVGLIRSGGAVADPTVEVLRLVEAQHELDAARERGDSGPGTPTGIIYDIRCATIRHEIDDEGREWVKLLAGGWLLVRGPARFVTAVDGPAVRAWPEARTEVAWSARALASERELQYGRNAGDLAHGAEVAGPLE